MTRQTQETTRWQAIQAVSSRELVTLARARSSWVLFAGTIGAVLGLVLAGGGPESGYLPTAVTLRLPMELLVPALAVALGYQPIPADARRGELEILETYPLPAWGYVLGIYVGRALALLVLVAVPLTVVAAYVAVTGESGPSLIASQQGVDSPLVFVRFGILTSLFGLTVLAMVLAASALAWSRRTAIVFAILVLGGVVLSFELFLLRGFGGGVVSADRLPSVLAVSPSAAYRGLVFETVLSPAVGGDGRHVAPVAAVIGLLAWTLGSLLFTSSAVAHRMRT
jgi:ABC-2 type transport system permease protein